MDRIKTNISHLESNRNDLFLYESLTRKIIGYSYEVMNELGIGFLESVYRKAFEVALRLGGLDVQSEVSLNVSFRGHNVGNFRADLIVEQKVIVEVKVAEAIIGEYKAQAINYLCASGLLVGLIVNFGQAKIQTARLYHPFALSSTPKHSPKGALYSGGKEISRSHCDNLK